MSMSGVDIEIKPLTFKEFTVAMDFYDEKKNREAMEYLLITTLRKDIPVEGEDGLSDEELQKEVDELPPKVVIDMIKKIQDVNGLSGDDESLAKKE